jgi:hypothetical protein
VEIPDGVDAVAVDARDLVDGWSGQAYPLTLPA